MRQSRNRNWGHPNLVRFLERLAAQAPKTGWRGLLVGDMSQPRGGPMHSGHFSHQVGLDADIWLTPMPDRKLTREEREEMLSTVVVAEDGKDVDPNVWTPAHAAVIKAAAKDPQVSRIFVNPAIKKALCRGAGRDRAWLSKVRPWYGHDYHFHVRIVCPTDSPSCTSEPPIVTGEVGGTVRLSAVAVLRFMTNSNLVGCWTGRSAGFSPLRMRPEKLPGWGDEWVVGAPEVTNAP